VSFLVKLFAIKGNLVVMNHLYHKLAVASVCTALSFTLVANKEAKAATITLESTLGFYAADVNRDGRGDFSFDYTPNPSLPIHLGVLPGRYTETVEYRPSYEFNIPIYFLPLIQLLPMLFFRLGGLILLGD
jgi:hypothetical protein